MGAVDIFVDLGVDLYHHDRLTDGLELLAQRLDYDGAGDMVTQLLAYDWSPETADEKQTPNPTPKPPPTTPPKSK